MEWVIGTLVIVMSVQAVAMYRALGTITNYEESTENIFTALVGLSTAVDDVLQHEIYSNEPVIVRFVDNLNDIEKFLVEINPSLNFNQLGETVDGKDEQH